MLIFQVELLFSGDVLPFDQYEKTMMGQGKNIPSGISDSDLSKNSRPSSAIKPKCTMYMYTVKPVLKTCLGKQFPVYSNHTFSIPITPFLFINDPSIKDHL